MTRLVHGGGRSAPGRAATRDALGIVVLLLASAYLGSGRLAHFDPALAGYFAAVVVTAFAAARRVSLFWRRPPSAFYGRALITGLRRPRTLAAIAWGAGRDLAAQRFLFHRGRIRAVAHLLLSWGTLAGFAVTLPLVFGWLRFEAEGERAYRALVFSVAVARFDVDGVVGWLVFHVLHLSAVAVMLGAGYFLVLRIRHRRERAEAAFHVTPLLLLLAVALTGLLLPVAARVEGSVAFRAAELAHEASVVALLVALSYGKLLHVFVRPLRLGAALVAAGERVACGACGARFAPAAQLEAVEAMLGARGFRFGGHPRCCPTCRRRQAPIAQTRLFGLEFQPRPAAQPSRRRAA